MRIAALTLVVLLVAWPAAAQVGHPCDVAVPAPQVEVGLPFAVGFCAFSIDVAGYVVLIDGVAQTATAFTTDSALNAAGRQYYETARTLSAGPGSHRVSLLTLNGLGQASAEGDALQIAVAGTPTEPPDACAIPFGVDAAFVFVTRWELTTKVPGSRMRVNFQLGSRTPITEIVAKVDGVEVARLPGGTAAGGLWMTQPAPGRYLLTVWVKNQAGCTREAAAVVPLVIK